jgi:hypothetical protein
MPVRTQTFNKTCGRRERSPAPPGSSVRLKRGQVGRPQGVRTMFTLYMTLMVAGIVLYAIVGLTHH